VVRAAPERFAVQPDLVSELQQLPGVIWACVTPPTPRHHRLRPHLPPRLPDLVAVVDRVESSRQSAELGYSHPANAAEPAEFENRVGLGANVVGLVLAGMGAVMRFTRLPAEVAGWWLVTAAEAQPRVRGTLEAVFGRVPTDVGMAVLNGVGPAAVEARCSGPNHAPSRPWAGWTRCASTRPARSPKDASPWPVSPAARVNSFAVDEFTGRYRQILATALRGHPRGRRGEALARLTDRAVAEGAEKAGVTREDLPAWRPPARPALRALPWLLCHGRALADAQMTLVSVKGAPETVLPRCTQLRVNGQPGRWALRS
jgi:hypothetical protein